MIAVNAFLNRDTRDNLSAAEQSYLHDSFTYTGGGLILTALAARTMFKSGVAFRIMSANPCALQIIRDGFGTQYLSFQGLFLVSGWLDRLAR
jgi:hypothetical protein